jgi:hypothetical protein
MAKSVSLHTDPEKNQFYATVFDQRCNTYMKTYSREGRLLNDIFIEHHSGNVAASLYVVNNSPTEQLAIGNYSSDCGSSLQGLYSATIQNGRQTSIRYYPFSRFRNFFDHLPAARQNRIADRIEQRHSAGKEFSLKENFWATQAVSEKNGQYISVGELFHLPQMGIDRVTTQYQSANRAVAAGFDTKGDLLWTNTYALPASDSLANPSLITLNMEKDAMRIAYITRTHLHTLLLGEYDQTMRLETYPINERFPEDELLEHPVARIEHWYKDKYLLFGVQVLRNYERNRKGEMRQVLYLIQLKIPELTTQAPAENR